MDFESKLTVAELGHPTLFFKIVIWGSRHQVYRDLEIGIRELEIRCRDIEIGSRNLEIIILRSRDGKSWSQNRDLDMIMSSSRDHLEISISGHPMMNFSSWRDNMSRCRDNMSRCRDNMSRWWDSQIVTTRCWDPVMIISQNFIQSVRVSVVFGHVRVVTSFVWTYNCTYIKEVELNISMVTFDEWTPSPFLTHTQNKSFMYCTC